MKYQSGIWTKYASTSRGSFIATVSHYKWSYNCEVFFVAQHLSLIATMFRRRNPQAIGNWSSRQNDLIAQLIVNNGKVSLRSSWTPYRLLTLALRRWKLWKRWIVLHRIKTILQDALFLCNYDVETCKHKPLEPLMPTQVGTSWQKISLCGAASKMAFSTKILHYWIALRLRLRIATYCIHFS